MGRHLHVTVEGSAYDIVVEDVTHRNDTHPVAAVARPPAEAVAVARPPVAVAPSAPPAAVRPPNRSGSAEDRTAPLAGVIIEILVAVGDMVVADQPVVVLEAMKMTTVISAHKAGRVSAIHVRAGDAVDVDQPLVSIS